MFRGYFWVFLWILNLIFLWALPAQQPPGGGGGGPGGFGGGGSGGGLVATARTPSPGRSITLGGRTAPGRKIVHTLPVAGTLEALLVRPGDRVRKGQPLLRVAREAVGDSFRPVVLEARLDGMVSEITPAEGEEVKAGSPGVTVVDDSTLVLRGTISDRDARGVQALGPLAVSGKTAEGKTFGGKILQLGIEPDYATGLFTLTLEFPRRPGLEIGTVLFVDLPVEKPAGILVRRTAVVRDGGPSALWVLDAQGKLVRREVVLGPGADDQVVVSSGLNPGERYLSRLSGQEKPGMTIRELLQANSALPGEAASRRPSAGDGN